MSASKRRGRLNNQDGGASSSSSSPAPLDVRASSSNRSYRSIGSNGSDHLQKIGRALTKFKFCGGVDHEADDEDERFDSLVMSSQRTFDRRQAWRNTISTSLRNSIPSDIEIDMHSTRSNSSRDVQHARRRPTIKNRANYLIEIIKFEVRHASMYFRVFMLFVMLIFLMLSVDVRNSPMFQNSPMFSSHPIQNAPKNFSVLKSFGEMDKYESVQTRKQETRIQYMTR